MPIQTKNIHVLLIDLDDTLYPHDSGVWEMIRARMQQYMLEEMGFPPDEVPALRERLWKQYGTTLRGLQAEYEVDMEKFLAYVHDVPIEALLSPDPGLEQMLAGIYQRKFIFTNANAAHAQRVMNRLGVADLFEGIIDIYAMTPHCKPQPQAFQKALAVVDEPPEACLLLDDSPINLAAARAAGLATVSVGIHRHDGSPHVESIHDLENLFK